VGEYMRINITGVDIIYNNNQYNIIKDNQLLYTTNSKETAVGLSLDNDFINKMVLQENNNIYILKVA
jgi:hypothetical protein